MKYLVFVCLLSFKVEAANLILVSPSKGGLPIGEIQKGKFVREDYSVNAAQTEAAKDRRKEFIAEAKKITGICQENFASLPEALVKASQLEERQGLQITILVEIRNGFANESGGCYFDISIQDSKNRSIQATTSHFAGASLKYWSDVVTNDVNAFTSHRSQLNKAGVPKGMDPGIDAMDRLLSTPGRKGGR